MTTVAALARDGHVWMAADSLVNVFDRPILDGCRKIRRVKAGDGEILVGCSAAAGMPSAISAGLKVDTEPTDDQDPQLWAEAIAHAVTDLAFEHHQTEDGRMDATLILGWRGRLWSVWNGVAIPHADGIAAVGSGEGVAIGVVDALLDAGLELPPVEILGRAVTLAIARDKHSAGPIWMEYLPAAELRSAATTTDPASGVG